MRASVYLLTAAAVSFTSLSAFANDYNTSTGGAILYTEYESAGLETVSPEGGDYISVGEITFVDDAQDAAAVPAATEYTYQSVETVFPATDEYTATPYAGELVDASSTVIETIDGITYETILAPSTTY